jgi:RNA polymerase sigma-70 factor (ECF subfamily)
MRAEDFEALYAEHAAPLFSFIAYRTGDRVLAEEIVADAFEKALRARTRFDRRKSSQKTWIYTIALNLLKDRARRRDAEARALERAGAREDAGPDPLAQVEDREQLARAMSVLSDEEREALALRYGADLTVPEIAKILKEPLSRVEGRVYRGLRKLREELA